MIFKEILLRMCEYMQTSNYCVGALRYEVDTYPSVRDGMLLL